jgi:hypothetical protein
MGEGTREFVISLRSKQPLASRFGKTALVPEKSMRRRVRRRLAGAGRAVERARAELQPVQDQPGWVD